MEPPFPSINVAFETSDFKIDITDTNLESITTFSGARNITNYEYETKKNDEKRKILTLKKEYLGVFIDDLRNIMRYDKSSQFIDEKTKRV
jgi:hypothetical protein